MVHGHRFGDGIQRLGLSSDSSKGKEMVTAGIIFATVGSALIGWPREDDPDTCSVEDEAWDYLLRRLGAVLLVIALIFFFIQ